MPSLMDAVQIGPCSLKHRVVMAPMTRLRANDDHCPGEIMVDYYTQRSRVPGTLLITEANFISVNSRGRDENAPGIYTDSQIREWSRITKEVHKNGSFIFMQLWHVGRAARQQALDKAGLQMVSSSNIPISNEHPTPRPMTTEEIWECILSFAQAAKNAIEAGFDGVELHAANGYLIDQFIQDNCNQRTDKWGGSIENRSRFCIEIVKAVVDVIGAHRTAVRLSPFSEFQGMRMKNPIPQFSDLITRLKDFNLAYLHLIEPRVSGNEDKEAGEHESLDFALKIWANSSPIILAGGYSFKKASQFLDSYLRNESVAFAFGRYFISNPDLPFKLANNITLTKYQRETFYKVKSPDGYTSYPFSDAWKASSVLRDGNHGEN
ncbi:hypothetical protein N7510_001624 [Penicillium lagena]|uniref:uncharacterized protein n=1 Tax=Penicillium lagena TaxID=94218 RepID=UPI002541CE88|nr:uncharacterized protein N7510_001624 [Penicillium lagena]KAJ5625315.1 hypothetical protein N7510_001624 [Penicillium lagena]